MATIVYIITKLELGGAQKVCLSLLDGVPQYFGHSALLISGTQGPLVRQVREQKNVILLETLTREVKFIALWREIKTFFVLIKQLRVLKKQYPDIIVHTHSTKAGLLGRWAAFFAGIKKRVHTVHGFGFNDFQPKIIWFIIYFFELVTSSITTHFVCVSQADIDTGIKLFPRFKNKCSLIRAAVDWQQFYQPARKISHIGMQPLDTHQLQAAQKIPPFIFGTVACFKKQKNLFDLLLAFETVYQKHPQAKLEIIGDGALRLALEEWVQKHQVAHAVVFHGWQERVAPIAQYWHAFVLTSLWEGLPCAVVEARLLKLPVISYKTGGIPEVIHDHVNGLLYEQKDWQSLASGMIKLIEQPKLYQQLSGYHDNLKSFQDNFMIERHAELYRQLG